MDSNKKAENYLDKLLQEMNMMNSQERDEIIQEIRSHIYESLARGNEIEDILKQLESPKRLGKIYMTDYQLSNKRMSISPILSTLQLGSLGLIGSILIPVLFFISALFIIMALICVGIAITNLFGFTEIPLMVITSNYTLTGFPQFIGTMIVSGLMIFIGIHLLKLILKYCKFTINKYKISKIAL